MPYVDRLVKDNETCDEVLDSMLLQYGVPSDQDTDYAFFEEKNPDTGQWQQWVSLFVPRAQ